MNYLESEIKTTDLFAKNDLLETPTWEDIMKGKANFSNYIKSIPTKISESLYHLFVQD